MCCSFGSTHFTISAGSSWSKTSCTRISFVVISRTAFRAIFSAFDGMMPCQPHEKPQRWKNFSPHPMYSSGRNVIWIASRLVT